MDTTGQREPPDTTTGVLDEELTPLDGWRPFDVLDDEGLEVDEVSDDEEDVAPLVFVEVPEPWELEVPGMVAALTTLKRPTPATAPIAAPVVIRFRVRIAESLARILVSRWP